MKNMESDQYLLFFLQKPYSFVIFSLNTDICLIVICRQCTPYRSCLSRIMLVLYGFVKTRNIQIHFTTHKTI